MIISIVGAESTGKTTLAQRLAHHYNVPWLPEYARDYLSRKFRSEGAQHPMKPIPSSDEQADLLHIGRMQWETEVQFLQAAAESNLDLSILDTDLLVIRLWWQLKFNCHQTWVEKQFAHQPQRLYLLTVPDFPWQADPLRVDRDNQSIIHTAYLEKLKDESLPFREISGAPRQRIEQAISAIEAWLPY